MMEFRSDNDGDTKQLRSCEAPSTLYLKLNARVLLMVNLTDKLVNGSRGIVKEFTRETVTVVFESVAATVTLQKHLFTVYDVNLKRDVASRKQIPLKLAYAFTVHKAQGMTLEHVEVDCRNMNFPGQLGVAVGRAMTTDGLRVFNYGKCYMRKQPEYIDTFYLSESRPLLPHVACCRQDVRVHEIPQVNIYEGSDCISEASDSDHFDPEGDDEILKLITDVSETNPQLGDILDLPVDLDLAHIMESWMYKNPQTLNQEHLNEDLQYLLTNYDTTIDFSKALWSLMIKECQKCLPEESTGKTVENKHLLNFHKSVTELITTETYRILVAKMFERIDISSRHFRAAYSIVEELRKRVIQERTKEIIQKTKGTTPKNKQYKSSTAGRAKIRYIGGWCIGSLKNNKKKMVKRNLYKRSYQEKVNLLDKEIKCLEELVVTDEEIMDKTTEITSLMEVQRKQNLRHGLTNITDGCFHFFLELDKQIRGLETLQNLNLYTSKIYAFISEEISDSDLIREQWRNLFTNVPFDENFSMISALFDEVLAKYLRMSSNQFMRECNQNFAADKEKAHRKQVLQKKGRTACSENWTIQKCFSDKSNKKISTHRYLQSLLTADSSFSLESILKKKDLLLLDKAYGINSSAVKTKSALSNTLRERILQCDEMINPTIFDSCPSTASSDQSQSKPSTSSTLPIEIVQDSEQPTVEKQPDKTTGQKRQKKMISTKSKGKSVAKKTKTVKWPCGICEKDCITDAVCCESCDTWHHFKCLYIDINDPELQDEDWLCPECKKMDI